MAIPIYTPPEEDGENNQNQPNQNDQNNNEVEIITEEEDFVGQLAREIVVVYNRLFGNRSPSSSRRRRQSRAEPHRCCCHNNNTTTTTPDVDNDPSGQSLDIKMAIDISYRRIGRDLRTIADNYQPHRRRRHAASSSRHTHIEVNVKLLLPLSLICCGLVYYNRK